MGVFYTFLKDHPSIKNKLIAFKVRQWMMGSLAGAATSYKVTEVYKGELIYNLLYKSLIA